MPCSGDKSATCVSMHCKRSRGIPARRNVGHVFSCELQFCYVEKIDLGRDLSIKPRIELLQLLSDRFDLLRRRQSGNLLDPLIETRILEGQWLFRPRDRRLVSTEPLRFGAWFIHRGDQRAVFGLERHPQANQQSQHTKNASGDQDEMLLVFSDQGRSRRPGWKGLG